MDIDGSDNYTKPLREYSVLGFNYNTLLAPTINSPYPPMDIQYLAYPNADNSYFSLTKDNNGLPYASIRTGYPGSCSFYNVVQCPTNRVTSRFDTDASTNNGCAGVAGRQPVPSTMPPVNDSIISFLNAHRLIIYGTPNTTSLILSVIPASLVPYVEVKDVSDSAVMNEASKLGVTINPSIVSSSTGLILSGTPQSFDSIVQYFSSQSAPHTSAPTGGAQYIVVSSRDCGYCSTLVNDLDKVPDLKAATVVVDINDKDALKRFIGNAATITGTPTIINLSNAKALVGYDASKGPRDLYARLQ